MEQVQLKKDIISRMQKNILLWQGIKPPKAGVSGLMGLGPVEDAFPNAAFPAGAIHEFVSAEPEHAAACSGFMAGLLAVLMQNGGACLWVGAARALFPPALKTFGVHPDKVIFVDLRREKDVLWAMEEALKCEGVVAAVAELGGIDFKQSRRLQLAAEKSRVTGFVLRNDPHNLNTTACAARWKISPVPSQPEEGMPGVGFPRWYVELLKVRNGNPGAFQVEWSGGCFKTVIEKVAPLQERIAG